jgi:hypothetical protein
VLAFTLDAHDVFGSEHAQALRNRGNRFPLGRRQFRNATVALQQPSRQPQAGRVAQSAKEPGSPINRSFVNQQWRKAGVAIWTTTFIVLYLARNASTHTT